MSVPPPVTQEVPIEYESNLLIDTNSQADKNDAKSPAMLISSDQQKAKKNEAESDKESFKSS